MESTGMGNLFKTTTMRPKREMGMEARTKYLPASVCTEEVNFWQGPMVQVELSSSKASVIPKKPRKAMASATTMSTRVTTRITRREVRPTQKRSLLRTASKK